MNRIGQLWWWLLSCCLVAECLAAFNVYQDIYANPAWDVDIGTGQHHLDDIKTTIPMMLNGNRYLCTIPEIQTEVTNKSTDLDLVQAKSNALELLQPLSDSCIYYLSGYWMYEVCYNKGIRQYHPDGGRPHHPVEGTPVYELGKFTGKQEAAVRNNGDVNYLKQTLSDGTYCDLIQEPRTIDVRYFCKDTGGDEDGDVADTIEWIREVKTCHYSMAINTPKLCSEVAFQRRDNKVNKIDCEPLDPVNPVKPLELDEVEDDEEEEVYDSDDDL